MYCKIVIPSHKRHDRVVSKDLVNNPIICVEEKQFDIYKEYNPDCEIVAHPNDVVGLIPKRNWMAKHFGDLFMIDDDVFWFKRNYVTVGQLAAIHDPSLCTQQIYKLYEMAKLLNISVFGFSKIPRPEQYDEFRPFSLHRAITGCAYGVIPNANTYWNEDMKVKEDYWISCLMKYHERKILVDGRYNFTQKDTFINPGGLSEIRNHDEEMRSMLILKKHFGDTVKLKVDRKNAKRVKKYDVTTFFKF
jgi:hypothetical protein